jgi:hypothetical protein
MTSILDYTFGAHYRDWLIMAAAAFLMFYLNWRLKRQ